MHTAWAGDILPTCCWRAAGGIYRQLVQRQLQSGFSSGALPTIAENGGHEEGGDETRSDTDDEAVYMH